tara:strand:+ start:2591 stop:3466 length:876 start_codon:yes stop_codon:yes gene_type:complete
MITVIGASGVVGRPAIERLVREGARLRALTSSDSSAALLREAGVEKTVVGDFRTDADLDRVLVDTRSVLYIPAAMQQDEAEIGKRVVAAASAAGVDHFVFISCFHSPVTALAHHHHKLLVEEAILEAGLTYTILQPSMFMQNLAFIWRDICENGVMRWPWIPSRCFNLVDVEDLAAVIVKVLLDPGLRGATFEICGPETISVSETAARLSRLSGKQVHAEQYDPQIWAKNMEAVGMSAWGINNMLNMARHYDEHGLTGGNPLVMEAILGRSAASYDDYVSRFLSSLPKEGV